MITTTTESSSNHHSPTARRINLHSPWAQVVRGVEPESSAAGTRQSPPPPPSSSPSSSSIAVLAPEQPMASSDSSSPKAIPSSPAADNSSAEAAPPEVSDGGDSNAGRSRKPAAWNKPSNGVVSAEQSSVMGAVSWPTLSETTNKTSGKLAAESSSSFKAAAATAAVDGSISTTTSQVPVTSHTPQRQATSQAKPSTATNYNTPNRHRPMKRGGSSSIGSGLAQSGFSNPPPPPPPPPFPVYQLPPVGYGNMVPGVPDHSPRDHYRHNNWDARPPVGGFVPAMNEHRGSSRRGNFGPHPRGDGSYHNNYGNRRDHDRGNYGHARDAHTHQPRMPPRGIRHPPPNTAAFVGPQPIGPFANPMGFHEFYYVPSVPLEHFRGMPFYTQSPPPAMYFPAAEPAVTNAIVNQIEYYFSDANLVRDEFLRSNMDEQGWVPVTLIADFPRVKSQTTDVQLILDSLRSSTLVEVQGDKLRRHSDWMRWLPAPHLRADSGSISPAGSGFNKLAADFQSVTLEEATKDEGPTESSGQSQLPNGSDGAAAAVANSN